MSVSELRDQQQARRSPTRAGEAHAVTFDESGKVPKLILPPIPDPDDQAALQAWLTSVLRLDPCHPVTSVKRYGRRGKDGHVIIARGGLPKAPLRFEPVEIISSARRFRPALQWQLTQTADGEVYGFKDDHCSRIAHVVNLLAGNEHGIDDREETAGIIGVFTFKAQAVEGFTTYGTSGQRYEAAMALRREEGRENWHDQPRFLIDSATGEHVIRTSDLQAAAREHVGSTLAHGWLDARLEEFGWTRATLQGYALPGRAGRRGPHLRCDVYRGQMPAEPDAGQDSVNT